MNEILYTLFPLLCALFIIMWMSSFNRQIQAENKRLKQTIDDLTTALEVFENSPDDAAIINALNTGRLRIVKYEHYYDNPQRHLHLSMDGIHVTSLDIRQGYAAIRTAQHAQRLASGEL